MRDYVVLDTETTGLDPDDEVIEIGVLDMHGTELYHSMFKPQKQIGNAAGRYNRIMNEMLTDCPAFGQGDWEKIRSLVAGKVVVGHSIDFHISAIESTMRRYGVPVEGMEEVFSKAVDTRSIAKQCLETREYTLKALYEAYVGELGEQRSALWSCLRTMELFQTLYQIAKERNVKVDVFYRDQKRGVPHGEAGSDSLPGRGERGVYCKNQRPDGEDD